MATSRKRGKRSWQVRWRDPDGTQQQDTVHSTQARDELLADVQRCEDLGIRYEPRGLREEPDFNALAKAWIRELNQAQQPGSVRVMGHRLDLIERWFRSKRPGGPVRLSMFSKARALEMHAELDGFEGTARKETSRLKIVQSFMLLWKWATTEAAFRAFTPPLEAIKLRKPKNQRTRAATWHVLDKVVAESHGRHRELLMLIRYTGLRVDQVMQLKWSDVDLERATLWVGTGKTDEARLIPISPHLVAELAGWGRREGYLVSQGLKTSREARGRDVWRFFERAGVDPIYWKQRPHHAFRKAFISNLKAALVDPEAVEVYVGHDIGIRGVYADEWAFDLEAVAKAIPKVGEAPADPRALRSAVATAWPTQEPAADIISIDGRLAERGGSSGDASPGVVRRKRKA